MCKMYNLLSDIRQYTIHTLIQCSVAKVDYRGAPAPKNKYTVFHLV